MRRHGLKARIRQQRRLARRLATQHRMVRRPQPGARMLEALGELSDEPVTPSRFVPPAESAPMGPQWHPEIMPPQYSDVHDYADIGAQPDDAPQLDAPSPLVAPSRPQRIAPASVHDVPPAVPASAPVAAVPNDRASSAVGAPRAQPSHTTPGSRAGEGRRQETQADRAVPRNTAPPPLSLESREATPVAQRVAISEPSRQGANEASSRSDVDAATTVDAAVDDTVRPTTAPESRSPGQSPAEPKPVEATSTGGAPTEYDAIVARALAALRASGELPDRPRRAPPPAAAPTAPTAAPAVKAGDEAVVRQPPSPVETRPGLATSDLSAPAARTRAEPQTDAAHAPIAAPVASRTTAPGPTSEAAVPSVTGRIDEQRQARRPALPSASRGAPDELRATSLARPSAPPPHRPAHTAVETRAGQFQFSDVGRTPQEWRRLLIEATSPQRAAPRPAPPARSGAQTTTEGSGAASRGAPSAPAPPARSAPLAQKPPAAGSATRAVTRPARPSTVPEAQRRPTGPLAASTDALGDEHAATVVDREHAAPPLQETLRQAESPADAASDMPPADLARADDSSGTELLDEERVAEGPASEVPATTGAHVAPTVAIPRTSTPRSVPIAATRDTTRTAGVGSLASPSAATPNVDPERSRGDRASAIAAPSRREPTPQAAPLSPSARRFLEPLVGIDPDTVQVRRDDDAARVAAAHGADAMAVGDAIVLASPGDERDPATLGLIAHELTHVARTRRPRFVPPVARGVWTPRGPTVPRASRVRGVDAESARAVPPPDDEEPMARVVEARVRDAAVRERAIPVTTFVERAAEHSTYEEADMSQNVRHGDQEHDEGERARARSGPWGALPAPWEPLPDFMTGMRASSSSGTTIPDDANVGPGRADGASTPSVTAVRLAERESGGGGEAPAHAEPPGPSDADGAPDIDALARQVYAVLRRRLAAERRRGA